jgi:bidirectional [NiFe] hydrogenase diaphorase subunit
MVASCLYPIREGIKVATDTDRIKNGRRCVFQKWVDAHPGSERLKTYGVTPSRFKSSDYEDFVYSLRPLRPGLR